MDLCLFPVEVSLVCCAEEYTLNLFSLGGQVSWVSYATTATHLTLDIWEVSGGGEMSPARSVSPSSAHSQMGQESHKKL